MKDYITVFPDYLNTPLCKDIIKDLNSSEDNYVKHMWSKGGEQTGTRDTDFDMSFHTSNRHEELMGVLYFAIQDYITKLDMDWFTSWNGYSKPRYNRYTKNTQMDMHCDHIHTLFTTDEDPEPKGVPILSIVGLLNNDFTGGEFIIGEKTINLNQGDIVMFPSNFIYPHRVATINNGERYSFVSWVW